MMSAISYHVPVGHLGPGHVLDGDVAAIAHPDPGVDGAEAALAEHLAHLVGALEGLPLLGADGGVDVLDKT